VLSQLEVAVDAYGPTSLIGSLPDLTVHMFRYTKNLCSENLRVARRKGEDVTAAQWSVQHLKHRLRQGFTIYIGNSFDDITQRHYTKTTDRSGKDKLPPDQHRARREVTLQGGALPFLDLEAASSFRFESLSEWFQLRRVKHRGPTTDVSTLIVLGGLVILGARINRPRGPVFNVLTKADTSMNAAAYEALRLLTSRMRATRGVRIPGSSTR
jgi:hypothetical protein